MYLLDTNVVSEVRKSKPDPGVQKWFEVVPTAELRLSVLVVGELRDGVERLRRRDPAAGAPLASWLAQLVSSFHSHIAEVDLEIAERWGRINADHGPLPAVDGLLAATALVRDWTLVSRNERHLGRTGVRLLNPFSDA